MKRLRLNSTQTRDWLQNRSYYVADGEVVRPATLEDPPEHVVRYRTLQKDRYLKEHGEVLLVRQDGTFLVKLKMPGRAPSVLPTTAIKLSVPKPEECQCAEYAGRLDGQHHAVCEYRDAWERISSGRPLLVIMNIANGKALRLATIEEAQTFDQDRQPIINIGGTQYGIVESPTT